MKRALIRWLIRLRWYLVAAAGLSVTLMVGTNWFRLVAGVPIAPLGANAYFYIDDGALTLNWYDMSEYGFGVFESTLIFESSNQRPWSWWFGFERWLGRDLHMSAPLWFVALLPLSLGLLGVRANRNQKIVGQCAKCRHTLAGASICPECGRAAEAAK